MKGSDHMQTYSNFGLQARAIMLQKKITMTALAKEIGVSCSYLSEIFKGTRPGVTKKPQIMEILCMSEPNKINSISR